MTTNKNINECGWFYHAPSRRKEVTEPIEIPITSQIPGLSDLPPEFDDKPREMYFKDTDTKYIRLAKQGGRKDLLVFKDCRPKTREAKGYPRVDWFYLEDNAVEDASEKKELDWQFLLPEYMVHDSHKPELEVEGDTYVRPGRAPYAFDSVTAFQREGDTITDKTVKLPELRPPGYGVRINKPLHQGKKQGPRDRSKKTIATSQSEIKGKGKAAPKGQVTSHERPSMEKLLSYTYDKEWHARQTRGTTSPTRREDMSEYTENYRKLSAASNQTRRDNQGKDAGASDRMTKEVTMSDKVLGRHEVAEEKEPFKLSKFKNIPARIDTHQKPDSHRKQN